MKTFIRILIGLCFIGIIACIMGVIFDSVKLPYIISGIIFVLLIINFFISTKHEKQNDAMKYERQWEKK